MSGHSELAEHLPRDTGGPGSVGRAQLVGSDRDVGPEAMLHQKDAMTSGVALERRTGVLGG